MPTDVRGSAGLDTSREGGTGGGGGDDRKRPSAWHSAIFNLKPIFPSSFITLIDLDLNLVNRFTTELLTSLLASTAAPQREFFCCWKIMNATEK